MHPMPAHERRVIHMVLREDKRVQTESVGKGRDRAITIIPEKTSGR
jgi:predicted RNA-binding protein Jag